MKDCLLFRMSDVLLSCQELDSWTHDFRLPAVVWLPGLFSPQSFLTGDVPPREQSDDFKTRNIYMYYRGCSCAAEYRSKESVAPGQDDSDCGRDKEAER